MTRLRALTAGTAPRSRRQIGLTIVELMIAGVIVAVLSSIAQPAYQNYRERARVTQAMRDIAAMSAIVADFFHDANA